MVRLYHHALSSAAALAILAACSGQSSNSPLPPASATGGMLSKSQIHRHKNNASTQEVLYVADFEQSVIWVYQLPNFTLITQISNGVNAPRGLATDASGNLYVGNTGNNTLVQYLN